MERFPNPLNLFHYIEPIENIWTAKPIWKKILEGDWATLLFMAFKVTQSDFFDCQLNQLQLTASHWWEGQNQMHVTALQGSICHSVSLNLCQVSQE